MISFQHLSKFKKCNFSAELGEKCKTLIDIIYISEIIYVCDILVIWKYVEVLGTVNNKNFVFFVIIWSTKTMMNFREALFLKIIY